MKGSRPDHQLKGLMGHRYPMDGKAPYYVGSDTEQARLDPSVKQNVLGLKREVGKKRRKAVIEGDLTLTGIK